MKRERQAHWRERELRSRFEQREAERHAMVLRQKARQLVHEQTKARHEAERHKKQVSQLIGESRHELVAQNHFQEVFTRRAEQNWDIDRKLRLMARSTRNASVAVQRSKKNLESLQHRIGDLKNMVNAAAMKPKTTDQLIDEELQKHSWDSMRMGHIWHADQQQKNPQGTRGYIGYGNEHGNESEGKGGDDNEEERARMAKELELIREKNSQLEKRAFHTDSSAGLRELGHLPPRSPTHLDVSKVGPESISLSWRAPVFDGGKDILEYKIEISVCHEHKIGKQIKLEVETLPPIKTTYWCLRDPVRHTGFTIHGLRAAKKYVNISVRAINSVGESPPSAILESVRTADPVPPSIPLHLRVTRITSSAVKICWDEPFHDGGGGGLIRYEVSYTTDVPTAIKGKGFGGVGGFESKRFTVNVDATRLWYEFQNVHGDTGIT